MELRRFLASGTVLGICIALGAVRPLALPAPVQDQGKAAGQRPGPPGTIRIRVRLIPVDVIVTDARGRPVTDLKQGDFRLFENGVPQQIRHFAVQSLTAAVPVRDVPAAAAQEQAPEFAAQSARTFLIMMGRGRFQTPFRSVDALIRFIRKELLPQDRAAVFAYNRATSFTTDHEQIAQVLERYKLMHERIEARLAMRFSGLAAIYGSKEIPPSYQAEINRIFSASAGAASAQPTPAELIGAPTMGKDARTVTEDQLIGDNSATRNAFDKLAADAISDLPFEEYASTYASTYQDVQNIYTCIEYMRYMEGEKHLLYFSPGGLFLPRLEQDESLAAIANDARVAVDTFQTGGLDPSFSWSRTFAISSMRTVAQLTGGRASIYQDVGKALTTVNETTRFEYLLGYYPQNENWDGKYRRITVKVNRPGVNVSYRRGYYARETLQPYNRELFLAYSRISAAAAYARDISDVAFTVNVARSPDLLGPPELKVDLRIDASKLGLKESGGIRTGRLYTYIFCADAKGKAFDSVSGVFEMKMPANEYEQALKSGVSFPVLVPYKYSNQMLKVVLFDAGSGRVGSKVTRMR